MIVSKITEQAVLHKREEIQPIYSRRWINEAMDTLSSMYDSAKVRKEAIFTTSTEYEEKPLPTDLRKLLHVFDTENIEEIYRYDYPNIIFQDVGSHKLIYLSKPKDVTIETETPEIHEAYHMILALYIASKEYAELDPIHIRAGQLMGEFFNKAMAIDEDLKRLNRKTRTIPLRQWR